MPRLNDHARTRVRTFMSSMRPLSHLKGLKSAPGSQSLVHLRSLTSTQPRTLSSPAPRNALYQRPRSTARLDLEQGRRSWPKCLPHRNFTTSTLQHSLSHSSTTAEQLGSRILRSVNYGEDDGLTSTRVRSDEIELRGGARIASVTLDNPARANALNPVLLKNVATAVRTLGEREDIRCIVLTGLKGAFCTGMVRF